jgi:hypothetical protein
MGLGKKLSGCATQSKDRQVKNKMGPYNKNACAREKSKKNNFRKIWQSSHTSKSGRLLHMLNAEVSTQADPGTAASQTFPASGQILSILIYHDHVPFSSYELIYKYDNMYTSIYRII